MSYRKSTGFDIPDAAELKKRAGRYFRECAGTQAIGDDGEPLFDKNGSPVMEIPETPMTVSGLAAALGFPSRRTLLEYDELCDGERAGVIERALSRIEEYAESKLFDKGQYSGAKFFLACNFSGWCEKSDDGMAETLEKLDAVLRALSSSMSEKG